MAGPTHGQLLDSSFPTFKHLAQKLHLWKDYSASTSTAFLSTGAAIRFRSADNPERLRGPDLSGAWLDEASLMEREALEITQACLREHGQQGWLSCTFTAKGLSHWTYELFGSPRPNTEVFLSTTGQNPFLPPDFEQQLQEQYGHTAFARQELGGEFVALEGAEWPPTYFENILYDTCPLHPDDVFTHIISLDPSMGKNARTGDYSALLHVVASRNLHLFVQDAIILRMTSTQCEDQALAFIQQFQPGSVVVESNGFQEVLADNILQKCTAQSVMCPMSKYVSRVDKEVRLRMTLTPYLANKRLHIRNTPQNQLLLAQMRDFPLGKHDDGPDALSLASIAFAELVKKVQQPQPLTRQRLGVR